MMYYVWNYDWGPQFSIEKFSNPLWHLIPLLTLANNC